MRPIFHLNGHVALKFNIKPVCDVFLKTQDLKSLPISNGNSIFASKKGKIFGPISNVNFRLECNSLSCWKNFSYVDWSLNTQKMSSTYLKYNSGLNLETDNSSFCKCARQKLEIVGPRGGYPW